MMMIMMSVLIIVLMMVSNADDLDDEVGDHDPSSSSPVLALGCELSCACQTTIARMGLRTVEGHEGSSIRNIVVVCMPYRSSHWDASCRVLAIPL